MTIAGLLIAWTLAGPVPSGAAVRPAAAIRADGIASRPDRPTAASLAHPNRGSLPHSQATWLRDDAEESEEEVAPGDDLGAPCERFSLVDPSGSAAALAGAARSRQTFRACDRSPVLRC